MAASIIDLVYGLNLTEGSQTRKLLDRINPDFVGSFDFDNSYNGNGPEAVYAGVLLESFYENNNIEIPSISSETQKEYERIISETIEALQDESWSDCEGITEIIKIISGSSPSLWVLWGTS